MRLSWRLSDLARTYSEGSSQELAVGLGFTDSFLIVREFEQSAALEPADPTRELELAQADPSAVVVFALPASAPDALGASAGKLASVLRLGRSAEAELCLDHPLISNVQLLFRADSGSGELQVTELGSRHGTKLNQAALSQGKPQSLSAADVIELSRCFRAVVVSASALHECLKNCSDSAAASTRVVSAPRSRRGVLDGKVAVITGAGRGLGRSYALRFALEGCRVVVNDAGAEASGVGRDAQVSAAVATEIINGGGSALVSAHDVTRADEVEALVEAATAAFGGIDILICSAGAMHAGSTLLTSSDETWQRLLDVNVMGAFRCVRAVAQHMIETGRRGRIITTSSLVALQGAAGLVEYSASKAAVIGMSKTAALELAPYGITVNVLTPMAWTRLTQEIPAIAAIPNVEHVLSPDYVADIATFLASDLSEALSGYVVDVGGPHLSFHRSEQGQPLTPQGARWTPEELHRRWPKLSSMAAQG